jgi:hypothetical protein
MRTICGVSQDNDFGFVALFFSQPKRYFRMGILQYGKTAHGCRFGTGNDAAENIRLAFVQRISC